MGEKESQSAIRKKIEEETKTTDLYLKRFRKEKKLRRQLQEKLKTKPAGSKLSKQLCDLSHMKHLSKSKSLLLGMQPTERKKSWRINKRMKALSMATYRI